MSEQKIAIVSGANRGIGKEIVRQLATINFKVIATARSAEKLSQLKTEISGDVQFMEVDISSDESCNRFSSYLHEDFSKIDVLVNNAGIMGSTGLSVFDLSQIEQVLNTNLIGAIRLSKAAFPLLKKSHDGRIINISSEMGAMSSLNGSHAAYRLSKWALNGFTIMMAKELQGSSISVNAMCPGWCRTDMGGEGVHRTASEGAETAIWLATSGGVGNGKFYSNKKEIAW